jgi:hypothetical protein
MTAELKTIETEVERILEATTKAGLTLRLAGSLAVLSRCPRFGFLASQDRIYRDIDLAGYADQARGVQEQMTRLGYRENREVFVLAEGSRAIFEHASNELHVDVFYDKLDFCHVISLDGRLEADSPTVPLAELLLGKMQIVKISRKDIVDSIVLLLEHPLGEVDREAVNVGRIARLCAADWGLWRTATMNLDKVRRAVEAYSQFDSTQTAHVVAQLDALLARIGVERKSLPWRLRAMVGDRIKWYKDVEEVT